MIINRINANNNFGAKIVGKLAEEIAHKREGHYPQHISLGNPDLANKITLNNRKDAQEKADDLEEAMDTIRILAKKAQVDITPNKKSYKISINGDTFYTARGNDEQSYKYDNLINSLSIFQ